VQDPPLVGVVQGAGHVQRDLGHLVPGRRGAADPVPQALPFHELHGDVGHAVGLAGVEDGDDGGVVEGGQGLCLPQEAGAGLGQGEDLEGDGTLEFDVEGPVDRAEASLAGEGLDAEALLQ